MMKVLINKTPHDKLWHFVDSTKKEIGGFGYCRLVENFIVIEEVFLVPQTVSGSEVDFGDDGAGVTAAINKAAADGVLGDPEMIWLSWHSHNTMKTFWSSTDENCIEQYAKLGIPRLLSIVGNHKHEYEVRLDLFDVEHGGIKWPQISTDMQTIASNVMDPGWAAVYALQDECDAEIKANVTEQKYSYQQGQQSYSTQNWQKGQARAQGVTGASNWKRPTLNGKPLLMQPTAFRENGDGTQSCFYPGVGYVVVADYKYETADPDAIKRMELGQKVTLEIRKGKIKVDDLKEHEFCAMVEFLEIFEDPDDNQSFSSPKELEDGDVTPVTDEEIAAIEAAVIAGH